MYSDRLPGAAAAAVVVSTSGARGAAARGPRAAHPASSVTASTSEALPERVRTDLVFLVQAAVAANDVEHQKHAENREQNEHGRVHLIFSCELVADVSEHANETDDRGTEDHDVQRGEKKEHQGEHQLHADLRR